MNREKFGVETSFDENLYTVPMSSLQMNEQEWKEVVEELHNNNANCSNYLSFYDSTWTWFTTFK